ncbi:twin-arginine translocase TatA/TatE family subunit [Anaerocolumna sp. MB42-C2]|jgi:sec-independent protein translocase protein TatA|uniref:twin-arginine translocase TatA/TatE family subunit n=1 Tax=Anaerocolumna sp. MB42-C2 TaxID=3070997 RepID=UPI0027E0D58E|nr:twin-arginine translocase TatA/TatE family subunit [Anaerocolumna sp. MB42-C2]WMJ85533.1 twin-arginine translocase TatA/TatE family subunit [Anaerocolumna sp. MB42-C2]
MGKLGTTEILLILGIALLVFGPSKLPELGKSVGKTISNFKKGVKDTKEDVHEE